MRRRIAWVCCNSFFETADSGFEVLRGTFIEMKASLQVKLVRFRSSGVLPRKAFLERPAELEPKLISDLGRESFERIRKRGVLSPVGTAPESDSRMYIHQFGLDAKFILPA